MDLGQELRLFGAKSTPPCWRKVRTDAPGRGRTATGRVRTLREEGIRGEKDRKGREGGSLKGEPLTQKGRLVHKCCGWMVRLGHRWAQRGH